VNFDRWFRRLNPLWRLYARLMLSKAKHRSLHGHPRIALRLSRWVRGYGFDEAKFFSADGAPASVSTQRKEAFEALAQRLTERAPKSLAFGEQLIDSLSDVDFVNHYRVPFQFRDVVLKRLKVTNVAASSDGVMLRDLDGNESFDLGGSYGVNLFGTEFYKACLDRAAARARPLGLVLGPYHPVVADNVKRLKEISGLDQVSFHMSGTEAVMQAVRLARYHSGRPLVVRFAGAYHGWWDGVQVGPGNPVPSTRVLTLKEMSDDTLRVLTMRDDIACVLVNPLQALSPNATPPADSALVTGERHSQFDRQDYVAWLRRLREICTAKGIALIFDEVFLGFRLAKGGAQSYFGVKADLVTYGKTLGGGLPVGALCGKHQWMQRFIEDRPVNICFARGTFNAHPYVMTAMNEFLQFIETPEAQQTWDNIDDRWGARATALNDQLARHHLPIKVAHLTSVFTTLFTQAGRYHWMFQYYLRAEGLSLSWVGSGRFILSHDYTDEDFQNVCDRFVAAGKQMAADGWFWRDEAVTAKQLKRQVTRELMEAWLSPGRPSEPLPPIATASLQTVESSAHPHREVG
jgi:glutamate-1-semialdehyde 2,1-aminomutase